MRDFLKSVLTEVQGDTEQPKVAIKLPGKDLEVYETKDALCIINEGNEVRVRGRCDKRFMTLAIVALMKEDLRNH